MYGKFGFTAIGNSPEEAAFFFKRCKNILAAEAGEISHAKQYADLDLTIVHPASPTKPT
jgi:hypothetical protein